jgi:hypothetical protein
LEKEPRGQTAQLVKVSLTVPAVHVMQTVDPADEIPLNVQFVQLLEALLENVASGHWVQKRRFCDWNPAGQSKQYGKLWLTGEYLPSSQSKQPEDTLLVFCPAGQFPCTP